jgi:AcrR family transcriptional regulator
MQKGPLLEREKIIDVAANLFGEKSYAGTSMRDISHALDMSIATTYYYFKNKEDLLFNIIESCGDDLLLNINKAIEESADPLERFRNMLVHHICLTHEKKNKVKVYVEEQNHLSKRLKNTIYKQHRKIYDIYINQLKELQRLKLIHVDSLPIAAFAIFGMVNWCYRWYREDGTVAIEDVAKTLIDLFFYGVLNPSKQPLPNQSRGE